MTRHPPPAVRRLARSRAVAVAVALAAAGWAWPLPSAHPVVRPFVAPATEFGAGHRGIDIGAVGAPGAAVYAPADGVVHYAGVIAHRPVLSIAHAGGVLSSYEPLASPLAQGDRVRRGQRIGTLAGGHCSTACLHLGARIDGRYVNPLLFFGDVPRAVLLPVRR